jgi:hypothetical protein
MEYGETQMSVDWLESKIQNYLATYGSISPKMISVFAEQAKAIHKEERISDYYQGACDESDSHGAQYIVRADAERWYNETFGGNK